MAEPEPKLLLASRLVYQDPAGTLRIRFDLGLFTIESMTQKGQIQVVQIDPEAMDRLVSEWPKLRKTAENPL